MSDLFRTGIRPAVDKFLLEKAAKKRDYGEYWSASSAGYCMRKNVFGRLKVPETREDARKQRVFEVGHIFHEWMQRITKESGLSIAQELELQDEGLMVRGHIDDLVLIKSDQGGIVDAVNEVARDMGVQEVGQLVLYDYKTQNSRAFSYQKDRPMSHFHKMQVGTYMCMLRKSKDSFMSDGASLNISELSEARILKISKDDLRMSEQQIIWSPELEKEVTQYWATLNGYWKSKTIPKCTCAEREGGFMAREAYNDYFFDGEPCSIAWAKSKVGLKEWKV